MVAKRRLPPPAASQVYELTPYGAALKPIMRELALWGLRSLGPPTGRTSSPRAGSRARSTWSSRRRRRPAPSSSASSGEVASIVDGRARPGSVEGPDVLVEADVTAFYHLFVDRVWDGVTVEGDRELLERLLDAVREPVGMPAAASA